MLAEPVQWFFDGPLDHAGSDSDEEREFVFAQRKYIKTLGRRRLDHAKQSNHVVDVRCSASSVKEDVVDEADDYSSFLEKMYPPPQFAASSESRTLTSVEVVDDDEFAAGDSLSSKIALLSNANVEAGWAPSMLSLRKRGLASNDHTPPVASAHVTSAIAEKSKSLCKTVQSRASWLHRRAEVVEGSTPEVAGTAKAQENSGVVKAGTAIAKGVVKAFVGKSKNLSDTARVQSNRLQTEAGLARDKTIDLARERAQIAKDMVKSKIMMFESKPCAASVERPAKGSTGGSVLQGRWSRAKPGGA